MELSAENLTQVIKDALTRYKDKEFGKAEYVQVENGFVVQFFDGPLPDETKRSISHEEEPSSSPNPMDVSDLRNITNPISPFNALGGFGGFGGGMSGGGGASGDW